jgi:methyltransferase (TIGR00027 family)
MLKSVGHPPADHGAYPAEPSTAADTFQRPLRSRFQARLSASVGRCASGKLFESAMRERESSRTAQYMALFRALESALPATQRLFDDPFARAFLPLRLRFVVVLAKLPLMGGLVPALIDHRWLGARTSGVARTRFIDDVVEANLRAGVNQVVILGAGFDARAYRMATMARATVFEVDHPSTSAAKRRLVEAALGSLPSHVRFVAIDFNAEPLPSTMSSAGFDRSQRTLFVWEGVTNYLTEDAVDAMLRWCASTPGGSTIVFTYVDRHVLDAPEAFEGTAKLFATLSEAGETWTFGLAPSHLSGFLARRGLVLEEDLSAVDYRSRYFGHAASTMRGYEFYRVAVARVPEPAADALHAAQHL